MQLPSLHIGRGDRPLPAVVAVREGSDRVLLRRETLEDQFRFEVPSEDGTERTNWRTPERQAYAGT